MSSEIEPLYAGLMERFEASSPQLSVEQARAKHRDARVEAFLRRHRYAILKALAKDIGELVSLIVDKRTNAKKS